MKINPTPYVIFKLQVVFYLNFSSLICIMRDSSSVTFYPKLYMIWTKRAHQSAKFQTLNCSCEISRNWYFDRLLLLKVYKKVKKVQRSYVSWRWRLIQNLNKNWFVVPKMTHIWWILTDHSEVSKTCALIGSFCAKYMFEIKILCKI